MQRQDIKLPATKPAIMINIALLTGNFFYYSGYFKQRFQKM
jgi:hypothetical protein